MFLNQLPESTTHFDLYTAHAYNLQFTALDTAGAPVTGHVVAWWMGDTTVATISSGGRLSTKTRLAKSPVFLRVGNTITSIPACVSPVDTYPLALSVVRLSARTNVAGAVQLSALALTDTTLIGIDSLHLPGQSTIDLLARDPNNGYRPWTGPCVHWKSLHSKLVVSPTGHVVVNAKSDTTIHAALDLRATVGPKIP
jgi:hypothetical protein